MSCSRNSDTEKYQSNRDNTTNVIDNIVEIIKDDVLIGSSSRLYLTDDYLIIKDIKSIDSILSNPHHIPKVRKVLNNIQFPSGYIYVNDTLSYAWIMEPTGDFGHNDRLIFNFEDMIQFGYLEMNNILD